jgi:hypothetical protein
MVHEVYVAVRKGRVESVGAVEGEVVSAVARPVVVRNEEAFVNTPKYLRADDLAICSLKLVDDLRGVKWGAWVVPNRVIHVARTGEAPA